MTSIQECLTQLIRTVFDDNVMGPELVLRAFGTDSENERQSMLHECKRNIGISCCALDQFVQHHRNFHPTNTGDCSLILCLGKFVCRLSNFYPRKQELGM